MKQTELIVYSKQTAEEAIASAEFMQSWHTLYKACPWATGYQSPEYAHTWYPLFTENFSPILLLKKDTAGALIGLLALAKNKKTQELVVVGNAHPEYRVWIALPEHHDAFIVQALTWLQKNYSRRLEFTFIPDNTPLQWLNWRNAQGRRCEIREQVSNILHIGDKDWLDDYMRSKKRLRTKFNKIKRMGDVSFRRIEDPVELDQLLEQIIPLYEFRQGATHSSMPFHQNPLKRAFTVELLTQKRLHVTVLTIDGQVMSALLAVYGHDTLHLGEIAYSVFHSDLSPGTIHMWLLVQLLAEEGFQILDLTPGGDAYKGRISADFVLPKELIIYPSQTQAIYQKLRSGLRTYLKQAYYAVKQKLNASEQKNHKPDIKAARYCLQIEQAVVEQASSRFNKNEVADLLVYKADNQAAYLAFLAKSLDYIYQGGEVYTAVEEGKLVCAVWFVRNLKKFRPANIAKEMVFADNAVWFLDMYPAIAENPEQCQTILRDVLPQNTTIYSATDDTQQLQFFQNLSMRIVD
jgi:CelD/BcsL family acetyltransferase involved in cellulose biosynthesis